MPPRSGTGSANRAKRAKVTTPGPWTRWRGSRAGRAIRFIQTYCRAPRGLGSGKPLHLLPWEKEWLEEFLADGINAGGLSIPRGNGKSTLGAALAVWAGFNEDDYGSPQVPIIAVTMQQAIRSVYSQSVSMVSREPELADRSISFTGIGSSRLYIPRTEGLIFPVSAEPDGLQGLDVYPLAVADEWGFLSLESWTSLLMARKRPGARVLGMGTPGLDSDNPLAHIRKLVREGAELAAFAFREFGGEPGASIFDRDNWRRANPSMEAGFPGEDFLLNAAQMSPEAHFRIFHLGEHEVSGVDCWLGSDGRAVWNRLRDPFDFVKGGATWVGIDVGLKRDSTAVVAVQYREDGRLHAKSRVWLPSEGTVDLTDVMGHLRWLCREYQVGAISYDPRLFELPAQMLHDEGLPMVEFPQSPERMTPVISSLYEVIQSGGLSHDGDEVLTTHVLNAVPRLNDRGFTLAKGKSRGHIDACISLALAVDRASHKPKPRSKVVVL